MPDSIIGVAAAAITAASSLAPSYQYSHEFEHYGYYLESQGRYYQAQASNLQYQFNLSKLRSISYAPVTPDQPLSVTVYQEDWQAKETRFYAYDVDLRSHDFSQNIIPKINKLNEQTYQLTFDSLAYGQVLFISDPVGLYAIGLGSPSELAVSALSSAEQPAYVVQGQLSKALQSFPDNQELKALQQTLESKVATEKAEKIWSTVADLWQDYLQQSDPESKAFIGGKVERELSYYLSQAGRTTEREAEAANMRQQMQADADAAKAQAAATPIQIPDISELHNNVTRFRVLDSSITLTLVDLGNDGDVLIRFSGLPNAHNQQVYRHKKAIQNPSTGAFIYQTKEITGDNWNTLVVESSNWYGQHSFVYPPAIEQQMTIIVDSSDQAIESAEQLYRDYVTRINQP